MILGFVVVATGVARIIVVFGIQATRPFTFPEGDIPRRPCEAKRWMSWGKHRPRTLQSLDEMLALRQQLLDIFHGLRKHDILAPWACTTVDLLSVLTHPAPRAAFLSTRTQRITRLLFGADGFPQSRYSLAKGLISTSDVGSSFLLRLYVIRLFLGCGEQRGLATGKGLGGCRSATARR